MSSNPQYDLVLLGPTGYTGHFCAQHIVKNHPTNLKWAIAGRSAQKIESIARELKELDADRVQPGMSVRSYQQPSRQLPSVLVDSNGR